MKKVRLGIVGSREWEDWSKIRKFIDGAIKRYGVENVEVVSGGSYSGADKMAKWLLQNVEDYEEVGYVEFAPIHHDYNEHCYHNASHYGQEYHVTNYFNRNEELVEYVNDAEESGYVVAFIPEKYEQDEKNARGTKNTLEHCESYGVKYKIVT